MTIDFNLNHLISRLKNGIKQKKNIVKVPRSKFNKEILNCLLRGGFINNYILDDTRFFFFVELKLNNIYAIKNLKLKSTSSRRLFFENKKILLKYRKTDFFILSTILGICLPNEVFFYNLGGLLILDNSKFK